MFVKPCAMYRRVPLVEGAMNPEGLFLWLIMRRKVSEEPISGPDEGVVMLSCIVANHLAALLICSELPLELPLDSSLRPVATIGPPRMIVVKEENDTGKEPAHPIGWPLGLVAPIGAGYWELIGEFHLSGESKKPVKLYLIDVETVGARLRRIQPRGKESDQGIYAVYENSEGKWQGKVVAILCGSRFAQVREISAEAALLEFRKVTPRIWNSIRFGSSDNQDTDGPNPIKTRLVKIQMNGGDPTTEQGDDRQWLAPVWMNLFRD